MTDPYDPYRQDDPYGAYGQRPGPYQGQPQGQAPYPGGQQPDATRQFGPYAPYGPQQQQPYRGSYGRPPGWGPSEPNVPGGPGGFPPQPPKKSKAPLIAIAVLAALLLLGGVVTTAIALSRDDNRQAGASTTTASLATTSVPTSTQDSDFRVGQCATLKPEDNNRASINVAECGGLLSDVVIAKVQDARCANPFLSFDPGKGKVYCLAMDAKEGDCFRIDRLIKRALACDDDETRKVVKIFDGVADERKCDAVPGTVAVYAYPEPPRTVCLGRV